MHQRKLLERDPSAWGYKYLEKCIILKKITRFLIEFQKAEIIDYKIHFFFLILVLVILDCLLLSVPGRE